MEKYLIQPTTICKKVMLLKKVWVTKNRKKKNSIRVMSKINTLNKLKNDEYDV